MSNTIELIGHARSCPFCFLEGLHKVVGVTVQEVRHKNRDDLEIFAKEEGK